MIVYRICLCTVMSDHVKVYGKCLGASFSSTLRQGKIQCDFLAVSPSPSRPKLGEIVNTGYPYIKTLCVSMLV